jgi:opacity protein-like surface antigen
MRDVVIDFEVFGAIVSPGPKKYSFFEPMGGLAKIINLGHLRGEREVRVAFNISNSSDYPRRLFVSSILRAPADVRDVRVKFDHPDITLNPGETRRMTASISATSRGHSELERFSVSLRAGASVPHGTFKQFSDVGANFGVGFEARANGAVSAEVIFGYHRFLSANLGPDLGLFQFSGNLKVYTPDAAVRFFASAGPGVYKFDPGDADIGGNFGSGIQYNVTSRFAVEGAYNLHVVNTPGSSAKFSTVQAGLRYRF